MKKTLVLFAVAAAFFLKTGVHAQDIWITVTPAPSPVAVSPTLSVTPAVEVSPSPAPTSQPTPSAVQSLDTALADPPSGEDNVFPDTPVANDSADMKPLPQVRQLTKSVFRAGENVKVQVIDDEHPDKIKVELDDSSGEAIYPDMEIARNSNRTIIKIVPPPQFKPGKYTLKVTDSTGHASEQDFKWGVLAINTVQSYYAPHEDASIHMAVLDDYGEMVCDAKLTLEITDPDGKVTVMDNAAIRVNPACRSKELTTEPDYESRYTTTVPGVYLMTLTAVTQNGTQSISSNFEVREDLPFNVRRTEATRIFPQNSYPVKLDLVADKDFTGSVMELVPESFDISELEGVQAYKIVTISDALSARQNLVDATDLNLATPFIGSFPVSNRFGDEEDDPVMKAKYEKYGVINHDGVDFALPSGTPVVAVDDGTVIKAKEDGDYGTTVVIQHSWGRSYYGHLSKIEKTEGNLVKKGEEMALSGNTGLSTGPHLHLGIKLNNNNPKNGYFGKTNPLLYVPIESGSQISYASFASSNFKVKVIRWDVSLKKGELLSIGYRYKAPGISPMFYTTGPLRITDAASQVVFEESRFWQIAADADGSGTNTVSPNRGFTSTTGNTYTYTFTATEAMDSGKIGITVPSGWSAPQGIGGTAGYTQVTAGTGASIADTTKELTGAGSFAGGTNPEGGIGRWEEDPNNLDACSTSTTQTLAADTTNYKEGTQSVLCNNTSVTTPDANDAFGYVYNSTQDWSSYETFGVWFRGVIAGGVPAGAMSFAYYTGTNAIPFQTAVNAYDVTSFNGGNTLTSGTWYFLSGTLTGTRTSIKSWGIRSDKSNGGTDSTSINVDDFLLGNTDTQTPTFSGSGPWTISFRLLHLANTQTVSIVYGSGGGASGVTNPSSAGTSTFSTYSRISANGTLTAIGTSPTVTISVPPTTEQQLRHGSWFNGGVEQPFYF